MLDCLRTMERRALANAMVSISLGRPDLTPRLAAIRCPTVFVTGSDHSEWTPDQAEAKSRLLASGLGGRRPGHRVPDPARGARGDGPDRPGPLGRGGGTLPLAGIGASRRVRTIGPATICSWASTQSGAAPGRKPVQTRLIDLARAGDDVAFTGGGDPTVAADRHGGQDPARRAGRGRRPAGLLLAWRELPGAGPGPLRGLAPPTPRERVLRGDPAQRGGGPGSMSERSRSRGPADIDEMVSVEHRIALDRAFATLSRNTCARCSPPAGFPLADRRTTGVPVGRKPRLDYATRILRGALTRDGVERMKRRSA